MSGLIAVITSYAGGKVGAVLVRWIAGKVLGRFGSSVLGRIGDAIERRRGTTEQGAK